MRRVITSVNPAGQSFVQSDEEIEARSILWTADPKDFRRILDAIDPATVLRYVQPPPGGMIWILVEYQPGAGMQPAAQPDHLSEMDERGFHVTRTIDFIYVLEGGIILDLDLQSVQLSTGDVVLLQAGHHAWRNPTDHVVRFIDVLVSGD